MSTTPPSSSSSSLPFSLDLLSFPSLSRDQIKSRIAAGDVLVLHRSLVYKLNSWLQAHPGGPLAILHFVGRDATDEIEAYHPAHLLGRMMPFVVGRVSHEDWYNGSGWRPLCPPLQAGLWPLPEPDGELGSPLTSDSGYASLESSSCEGDQDPAPPLVPPSIIGPKPSTFAERLRALEPHPDHLREHEGYDLSPSRQQQIACSYRALHSRVRDAGMYEAPRPFYGYGSDLARFAILFTVFFITSPAYPIIKNFVCPTSVGPPGALRSLVSAVFLGLWWHQITFVAHDAGHSGVTGKWTVDRLIGILIGNFCGGMSIGWWCDNHDVHHLVTNHPEHDPDIQHLPFFAISNKFFKNIKSTYYNHTLNFGSFAKRMVRVQHRAYYPVMLFARFNLFANSYRYLMRRRMKQKLWRVEIAGIVWFWIYFGTLLSLLPSHAVRVMYVLVSFAVTSPLHVQIVLSHFAQSTADLGLVESFAHRQLRTTTDVTCPPWLDFLHGGLNMQVTHHLFPRLPRHRLREVAEKFVKPWCLQEGLVFNEIGFVKGNVGVLGRLKEVANQVRVVGKVAAAQAKGEIH